MPYPHATADHQALNAAWLTDGDAALMVRDEELTGDRVCASCSTSCSPIRRAWHRWATNALELAMPDAAERIADQLLEAAA